MGEIRFTKLNFSGSIFLIPFLIMQNQTMVEIIRFLVNSFKIYLAQNQLNKKPLVVGL